MRVPQQHPRLAAAPASLQKGGNRLGKRLLRKVTEFRAGSWTQSPSSVPAARSPRLKAGSGPRRPSTSPPSPQTPRGSFASAAN